MATWLIKSEPETYSWDNLVSEGRARWDGVRNYEAKKNLAEMKVKDLLFFYHSGRNPKIVGIARVVRTAFPDPTDASGRFLAIEIIPVRTLKLPVTLQQVKSDRVLRNLLIVRQPRLSVSPVTEASSARILELSGN